MTRTAPRSATLLALAAACLALAAPAFAEAKHPAATEAVKKSNDALRGALKKMFDARGPAWDKAREEARASVSTLLDFDALAEGTLGKHWADLKPPERKRYVEAMRSAMEASYLSRMQGKVSVDEVKVDYLGEELRDSRPLVHTRFTAGQDAVLIDYLLEKGPKKRAVDVITEGVSLSETYREQINTLWPKKGFEGVVTAFEKKAKRFEADLEAKRKGEADGGAGAAGGK